MLNRDALPLGLWDELLDLQAKYEAALAALQAAQDEEAALRERHNREIAPWVRVRTAVCEEAYRRFEVDRPEEGGPAVAALQLKLDVASTLAHEGYSARTRDANEAQRRQLKELAGKMEGLQAAHDAARRELLARLDHAHGLLVAAATANASGTASNPTTIPTTTANGQSPGGQSGSAPHPVSPAAVTV